jgi:hypothetical protein
MATSATGSILEWRASSNAGGPLGSLETMSTIARFSRGDLTYLSGDPADFWYRLPLNYRALIDLEDKIK